MPKFRFVIVGPEDVTGTDDYAIAQRHLDENTTVIDTARSTIVQLAAEDGGGAVDIAIPEQTTFA